MVMQIRRTPTVDHPPSGLAEGQLAVEMASDPPKLWVGVPATIDPSGRVLIVPRGGAGGAVISTTPPATPAVGDLWFDPVEGQLYIWFDDGSSQQWVVTINRPVVQGPPGRASQIIMVADEAAALTQSASDPNNLYVWPS